MARPRRPRAAPAAALQLAEHVEALRLDRRALYEATRIVALAHGALGAHAEAEDALARAAELARTFEVGGLRLTQLHAARARLALAQADATRALDALEDMRRSLEHADAPGLSHTSSDHLTVLLMAERDGERLLVGIALLAGSQPELRPPSAIVVRTTGQALWAAGDSIGRNVAD